jgi:hypothetical protein
MRTDYAVASRFNVGDQVVHVGPGFRNGDPGEVVGVTKGFDSIYRYDVRFSDGTAPDRCFGYECNYIEPNHGSVPED